MDASTSAAADDYISETLSRSLSHSRLDPDRPFHRPRSSSSSTSSTLTSSPSDPCLYNSAASWNNRLNARAPEFKPRGSGISSPWGSPPSSPMMSPSISSSSLSSLSASTGNLLALAQQSQQSDLAASFVIPRPPGPPALVHIFSSGPGGGGGVGSSGGGSNSGPIFQIHPSFEGNFGLGGGLRTSSSQLQLYGGVGGFLDQHHPDLSVFAGSDVVDPSKFGLSEEAASKIINQVEFYLSDINLATTGFLFKIMIKDPEGFLPMSVIASIKKIKALTKNQSQLAAALRNSSKLVVSEDGKKVRRLHPLSELDMEEVQSRIIIAENLPDDHSHQKLLKIFSAVGSLKAIRTCQPSAPSTSKTSKTESVVFSNKVHAFVEYETVELAERAVLELNKSNWRNGLKVWLLLKRSVHSPQCAQTRVKKVGQGSENNFKEEDGLGPGHISHQEKYVGDYIHSPTEPLAEDHTNIKDSGMKKSRSHEFREANENRGWGKGRGRPSYNSNNRGNHVGVAPTVPTNGEQQPAIASKQSSVPRMPDGTRGFSMGRGKPVALKIA